MQVRAGELILNKLIFSTKQANFFFKQANLIACLEKKEKKITSKQANKLACLKKKLACFVEKISLFKIISHKNVPSQISYLRRLSVYIL